MRFTIAVLVFLYVGRKLGWLFSRAVLYLAPIVVTVLGTLGAFVGIAMSGLIGWLHPGMVIKWIFGFALGAYVSVPNFGLFNESTIPDSAIPRHFIVSQLSWITYVATEFATKSMR